MYDMLSVCQRDNAQRIVKCAHTLGYILLRARRTLECFALSGDGSSDAWMS
jgi:hypothetical protein